MLDLKKINNKEELKQGMDVLVVGSHGGESLERVDCIDNEEISTVSPLNGIQKRFKKSISDYVHNNDVYEVRKK
jgi:hypothetical protein